MVFKTGNLNNRYKIVLKYFLTLLFIAYYFSITLFYHSHVINGKEVVHSHFYWNAKDTSGKPVKHNHSQSELVTINIITHFVTTVYAGYLFLPVQRFLLNSFLIPLSESIHNLTSLVGYQLRGPPSSGFSLL